MTPALVFALLWLATLGLLTLALAGVQHQRDLTRHWRGRALAAEGDLDLLAARRADVEAADLAAWDRELES